MRECGSVFLMEREKGCVCVRVDHAKLNDEKRKGLREESRAAVAASIYVTQHTRDK